MAEQQRNTVRERVKERRKHVRRESGTQTGAATARGGGRTRLRAEDVGGVSAREEYRQMYSPVSPIISPQQFAIYKRSLTEGEVITATLRTRRGPVFSPSRRGLEPLGYVAPVATQPVEAFKLPTREDDD